MVENLESLDDLEQEGDKRNLALAAIAGSALAAGLLAFLIRRARQEQAPEPVGGAWDRARELAFSEERAAATREFLVEKVLPELKPALLGILEEIEDLVEQGFRRAEKAIKSL
ncbi:MAG TPA: hypothetical protein VKZ60_05340 [Chloroflexota bacterium]|jgi:hypothetical protein|nr:hypothetical protein [Chloroflexota bacterium]